MRRFANAIANRKTRDTETPNKLPRARSRPKGLVMGPTMDHAIIRSLFAHTAAAARALGRDAAFAARLDDVR